MQRFTFVKDPKRILLVRLSHLGDVVHAFVVYHALHEAYPDAEIGWVIQPEFAPLVAGLPGVGAVMRFERHGGWRAWPRLRRGLRRFRPDWTVDAQGNLKSAAVVFCSAAVRRFGLAPADWRERLGARGLTDPAPVRPPGELHLAQRMLGLARHVAGARTITARGDPGLASREIARGRELAERYLAPEAGRAPREAEKGRPRVLLVSPPGDVRSWNETAWGELAAKLARDGHPTCLITGPGQAEIGRRLARRLETCSGLTHWVAQDGLRELASFFHAAAERGAQLVACDSGPMHLATACGLAVVCLEGPQDARRTGPFALTPLASLGPPTPGQAHGVVRSPSPPPCAPCRARRCGHPAGPVCMNRIEPAMVVDALGPATAGER